MSTRSSIAVEHEDGSVTAVYCHFDGYLTGVGEALLVGHDSYDAAVKLTEVGDLSTVNVDEDGNGIFQRGSMNETSAIRFTYRDYEHYRSSVHTDIGDNGYRYIFKNGHWRVWGRYDGLTNVPVMLEKALGRLDTSERGQ